MYILNGLSDDPSLPIQAHLEINSERQVPGVRLCFETNPPILSRSTDLARRE